ncbi:uncharacterized protein LOC118814632 [Colossoma macropomum]|uniref:uncharacterized protein LOC118814632 n=1 Tax=Colossoma macropomum TaxID=42526 RepID=UPI00186563E2|nr:uncharacterized protein LOC118814632 [Colossoma macropomum]
MEPAVSHSDSSSGDLELDSEWDYGDSGNSDVLQEIRIVLLGSEESEKSSAGNTILGKEEFGLKKTAQCVKRQGKVAGRHITVVEAPGWWKNKPVAESTELLKQEIVFSVSLCPPGPHAVLLVIDVDSVFTEEDKKKIQGYVNLLGEGVWNYTVLLFTSVECLGDTPIEQHIESEGKELQWLVEKCGNRYHVLNNENRSDDTQVTELLEKIEEMVLGNSGCHFEVNRRILLMLGHRRREEDARAKERMMKVQKKKHDIRSQMGHHFSHHHSEMRIVLLGYVNAGRSAVGNSILDREEFPLDRATQCLLRQGKAAGRHITVVEAPGWWSNKPVEDSTKLLKQEIVLSVSLCPPGPHALIVVVALRFNFQESDRRVLEGYMELLSDKVWSHTIVVFTYGDWLGNTTIEHFIESEGRALQWLIEKCGNRYHVLNNMNRGDDTQVTELLEKIEEMVAANRGCHFEMSRNISRELEEWRAGEERAKVRMMKVQKQRQAIRAQMDDTHHLSDLRILLLGYINGGRSSAGNTILGRKEFDFQRTTHCVKRQGEVAGRRITVVEAPGWWSNKPVEDSTELLKREIVFSVSLCPPGPHTVLLVVSLKFSFKETYKRVLEGYLMLLSEKVWNHTIVLFTSGDCLGNRTIEQYIECEGKALQWLVEKCGNRYHVFNNKNRGDETQVRELLEKIEEMVAANSGQNFDTSRNISQELEERRAEEERAKERMMKVKKQRQAIRGQMDDTHHLSELRILLLGYRNAGKSSAGNTILDREEFELKKTAQCVKRQGEVAGRHITVVEAPGWWSNRPIEKSTELLKQEIALSVSLCPPGPHTILLVVSLKFDFKETDRRVFEGFLMLLTEKVWDHTILLFTSGDCLGNRTIEQYIECEGKALQWLVEKCGNRYHVFYNRNRSDSIQLKELLEKIEEMVAANSGCHFEMDRKILQKIEEKRRVEEERANERMTKVQQQRENLKAFTEPAVSDSDSSSEDHELDSEWDYGDSGNSNVLQETRIVLLGTAASEKSSAGNTILGRQEFELKSTAQCVKRQGEVAGRHITVVAAPGWRSNKPVEESTELLKREIVLSLSLCPPGPHAILLVIDVDSVFTEKNKNILEGYVNLLGEGVWNYTVLLFTSVECLRDRSIEQHIESEGKALHWLVEKCGNRYHVLNNKNRADQTQVTELLEKIEEMVLGNSGCHFEGNRMILLELGHRRREEDARAKERMMKVQTQRHSIRSQMGNEHHGSEMRIVLLGYVNAGRSAVGNTILDREEFPLDRATQCMLRQGEVAGRHITVVEAPGWWSNETVEESTELLKQEIVLSVSLCPPGPHVLLVVLSLRFNFQESDRRALEGYMKLLSDKVWSHTIVVFTYGDWLGNTYTIEHFIESEGRALQWLIEKCGNRYHVLNNKNRGDDTQVTELLEKIEEMVAANSGCHFEIGRNIFRELEERRAGEERAKERMMKVQKQKQAIRAQMDDTHHLSDLRILLLGYINGGRSSSGNTILGRKEFDFQRTTHCVKRQGEVAGRHITVVEAPGWWSNKPVEENTELLKREIVLSVSLCPPGPHTVLLVVSLKFDFKERDRRVLEGYLMLLTEKVWNHTIVLFTSGDCLGNRTIEQYIECEGKALQWLVEKCGNRYHVLNNKNRSDSIQLTELLEKIEEMVAENSVHHFEMDRKILQEVEEKRRAEEERAKERMMKVQQQRENLKAFMGLRKRRPGGVIIQGTERLNKRPQSMLSGGPSIESDQRESRPPSPVPSYLSMKSDVSMNQPPGFTGESSVSLQSVQSEILMEDHGACCICKEVLKDPLLIRWGYCSQCAEIYWTKPGLAVDGPKCRNTNLAPEEDKETRKLRQANTCSPSSAYWSTGPTCVVCDFCCGKKQKAVKSCLTCTASYCETHVKEHYTVTALQRHILVEATADLEQKLCQLHHRALEVFCKTDQMHICTLCLAFEHRGHDIEVEGRPAAMIGRKAADISSLTTDKKYLKETLFICFFCMIFAVILYHALMLYV